MNGRVIIKNWFTRPALVGAALAVLCGLLLWWTPLGVPWENASYDCLFNFGTHAVTNQVVLIRMDNDSYQILGQNRDALWDRKLHTDLLTNLTAAGAWLVVFDILFQDTNNPETDAKLAEAMRRNGHVVLTAFVKAGSDPKLDSVGVDQPHKLFLAAAAGHGVGQSDALTGQLARRHWPFYAPGEGDIHSLGWAAAQVLGKNPDASVEKQWLRYYGKNGPGTSLPYYQALMQKPGFFRDKIVFIGGWPSNPNDPGFKESSNDKFRTPYTHQTGKAVGGVEIMATTLLNLINGDWLRRPPAWVEFLLLALTGILIGGGLCRLKPLPALLVAVGIFFAVLCVSVSWSYFSNWWFPWLVIGGGQLPLALAWSWVSKTKQVAFFFEQFPGYFLVDEKFFGEGAFGKVWRVRDVFGELQALKVIKRSNRNFEDASHYDREFSGIKDYMPHSSEDPGLLHIGHVNCNNKEGYFYYVMELGDPLDPDWEKNGGKYKPRDLHNVCHGTDGKPLRLPVRECLRISRLLLEALHFLHERGLVHRDIKPSNIIFVKDRPKLADVGLVRKAVQLGEENLTIIGTKGFMPPLSEELLGTKVADIYAMGKVLYVISTGKNAEYFSELPTTLVEKPEFMRLNEIICRACQPAADQRYADAAEMLAAVRAAQAELDGGQTQKM